MERRDYLEREIEKMRAVLQKIFGLRVYHEEEARELISAELARYFHITLPQALAMSLDEFKTFVYGKNVSLVNHLGNLLHASVNWETADKDTLRKILIAWDCWETKTKTLDLERAGEKERIQRIIVED